MVELEKVFDFSFSELWSQRLLLIFSVMFFVVIDSEEEDSDICGDLRMRYLRVGSGELDLIGEKVLNEGFLFFGDLRGEDVVVK